jgi:hypothetical protein
MTDVLFAAISCNSLKVDGAWEPFAAFVEDSQPRFLVMMGDQVYIDDDEPDIFDEHFGSRPEVRREALAEKYRLNWSREPVRQVLANIPTYMIWDDHEIRDGWGSFAPDSPTLRDLYPRGAEIYARYNKYFEDTRDVYWHFQGCHNPLRLPNEAQDPAIPNYIFSPPQPNERRAMPFAFRCGRMVVVVLDSRGRRDAFRKEYPVLGTEQWQFIDQVFGNLADDVEALAVVTATPIASMAPDGQAQKLFGRRTDDVELFKRGDLEGLLNFRGNKDLGDLGKAVVGTHLSRFTGTQVNLGSFKLGAIDEARDQWSHHTSRPEQEDLIRKAGAARFSNRTSGTPRGLIFLSGDIHVGGIYDITVSKPKFKAASLISSGISKDAGRDFLIGVFLDEDFEVAPGIHSKLRNLVNTFNFGVLHVIPTGSGAKILGSVAHEGNSFAFGVDISDLLA